MIGLVDPVALERVGLALPSDPEELSGHWDYKIECKIGEIVLAAFGHLAADLRKKCNVSDSVALELSRVGMTRRTVEPFEPFIFEAEGWHSDDISAPNGFDLLVHDKFPTQYLAGQADKERIDGIMGFGSDKKSLSASNLIDFGAYISRFHDENIPFPELSVVQPIPYAAHLLTSKHLHRTALNLTNEVTTRTQYHVAFRAT